MRILRLIHRYHNLILLVILEFGTYLSEAPACPLFLVSAGRGSFVRVRVGTGFIRLEAGPVWIVPFGFHSVRYVECLGPVLSLPIYRGRTPLVFHYRTSRAESYCAAEPKSSPNQLIPNQVCILSAE